MLKNKPVYIFLVVLIAIVTIAISAVVSQYKKNRVIVPDKAIRVISSNDMEKIKASYESQGKKEEFLATCSEIEIAVVNKFLNGSVTNEDELAKEIQKINSVLNSDDWSYLELQVASYWMGDWKLDKKGAVTFSFVNNSIKPSWAYHEDVIKYIK